MNRGLKSFPNATWILSRHPNDPKSWRKSDRRETNPQNQPSLPLFAQKAFQAGGDSTPLSAPQTFVFQDKELPSLSMVVFGTVARSIAENHPPIVITGIGKSLVMPNVTRRSPAHFAKKGGSLFGFGSMKYPALEQWLER